MKKDESESEEEEAHEPKKSVVEEKPKKSVGEGKPTKKSGQKRKPAKETKHESETDDVSITAVVPAKKGKGRGKATVTPPAASKKKQT